MRVPVEVVKQRAQVHRHLSLSSIARSCLINEVRSSLDDDEATDRLSLSCIVCQGFHRSLPGLLRYTVSRDSFLDHSISSLGILQGNAKCERRLSSHFNVLSSHARLVGVNNKVHQWVSGKELFVDRWLVALRHLSLLHSVRCSNLFVAHCMSMTRRRRRQNKDHARSRKRS